MLIGAIAIGAVAPGATGAKIVYPPDGALLAGDGKIEVLALRPAAAGSGRLAVAQQGPPTEHPAAAGVSRVRVALLPGRNTLQLDGETVTVFLEGAGAGKPPAGFEVPDAHALENACQDCHRLEGDQVPLIQSGAKLCLRCHDDVTRVEGGTPVLHPPAQEGDCAACHRLHQASAGRLSPPAARTLCLGCHKDPANNREGAPWATPHRPVAKGVCDACHDPHATPRKSLLTRSGNQLCQSCHKEPHRHHRTVEVDSGGRPPAGFPRGFPVSRTGVLGCGGCHRPHGSDNQRLWVLNEQELCTRCHKKY